MSQHLTSNLRKIRYTPTCWPVRGIAPRYKQSVYLGFGFGNKLRNVQKEVTNKKQIDLDLFIKEIM